MLFYRLSILVLIVSASHELSARIPSDSAYSIIDLSLNNSGFEDTHENKVGFGVSFSRVSEINSWCNSLWRLEYNRIGFFFDDFDASANSGAFDVNVTLNLITATFGLDIKPLKRLNLSTEIAPFLETTLFSKESGDYYVGLENGSFQNKDFLDNIVLGLYLGLRYNLPLFNEKICLSAGYKFGINTLGNFGYHEPKCRYMKISVGYKIS